MIPAVLVHGTPLAPGPLKFGEIFSIRSHPYAGAISRPRSYVLSRQRRAHVIPNKQPAIIPRPGKGALCFKGCSPLQRNSARRSVPIGHPGKDHPCPQQKLSAFLRRPFHVLLTNNAHATGQRVSASTRDANLFCLCVATAARDLLLWYRSRSAYHCVDPWPFALARFTSCLRAERAVARLCLLLRKRSCSSCEQPTL